MGASNALEIYTTFYGWIFYNRLWDLFTLTGIVYFPFLLMLWSNWTKPISGATSDAPPSVVSVNRNRMDLLEKIIIVLIAAQPFMDLQLNSIATAARCPANGANSYSQETFGGSTGTTFDSMLSPDANTQSAKVPILWMIAMALGEGINRGMTGNLPCLPSLAELHTNLQTIAIPDPALRSEFAQFTAQCYLPARQRVREALNGQHGNWGQTLRNNLNASGNSFLADGDLDYPGSEFFVLSPGLYTPCSRSDLSCPGDLRALSPVDAFPYDPSRDTLNNQAQINAGQGFPWCYEWWNQGGSGLNDRLVGTASFADSAGAAAQNIAATLNPWGRNLTEDELDRLVITSILASDPPDPNEISALQGGATVVAGAYGTVTGVALATGTAPAWMIGGAAALGLGAVTVGQQVFGWYSAIYLVKRSMPMIQAVLLMVIYMLLPFFIVLMGYEVEGAITAFILIVVTKFWSTLFIVAEYLDDQLYNAMFPDHAGVLGLISSFVTLDLTRLLLDMVLMALFVAGPLVLTALVGMAGHRIKEAGNSTGGLQGGANATGQGAGKAAGGLGTAAVNKLKK